MGTKKIDRDQMPLVVKYNPGDQLWKTDYWGNWYQTNRKKRVSFEIQKKDRFVLNFDQVDLATIEFYLNNRINRADYLTNMPLLEKIREELLKESQHEENFKMMLEGQYKNKLDNACFHIDYYVRWWKLKNKWKRAVKSDDNKAYRMIIKELNKLI